MRHIFHPPPHILDQYCNDETEESHMLRSYAEAEDRDDKDVDDLIYKKEEWKISQR